MDQYNYTEKREEHSSLDMSVVDWLITLIILAIPIVNIIAFIYWIFLSSGNVNRRNFCLAYLILIVSGILLVIIFQIFCSMLSL